jgi:hypothetical protein
MPQIIDLVAVLNGRGPPQGRRSAYRVGDIVTQDGQGGALGRIEQHDCTTANIDLFYVRWDSGRTTLTSHLKLHLATVDQRVEYMQRQALVREASPSKAG